MATAERSSVMASRDNNRRAPFEQLFAGVSAGIVTTICTHPLDLIKTRMQGIQDPKPLLMLITVDRDVSTKFGGFRSIAKQVYADRGLLSFYRGLSPNMVGNAASWGFYFMWYVLNFVN
jgi:solute carrier family 25 folate transporter 32